jgi:hypothetical protein
MTTAATTRHDVRITIADSAGARARVALAGVTVFELATLRLPAGSQTAAAAGLAVASCGGCNTCAAGDESLS